MIHLISSDQATFKLDTNPVFRDPLNLTDWFIDRDWMSDNGYSIKSETSIDGHLNTGFVPHPINMGLELAETSSMNEAFEAILD